jgi:transposase-like protein
VALDGVIHLDGWPSYHGLVDMGFEKHLRVERGNNEFANSPSHINGIESFWAYAKRRLSKMKGIQRHIFYPPLKETEFCLNHRRDSPYHLLLRLLRKQPI